MKNNEPTKAEKQIAIDAAKKLSRIQNLNVYYTQDNKLRVKNVWRVLHLAGHNKDFKDEYEAALYVLKQELMR